MAKEYIERGALIAEYDRVHVEAPGGVRKLMENAPAADVVEVVRCHECKFYNNHGIRDVVLDYDACHWNADEQPDPDDDCSAGERKDGAE